MDVYYKPETCVEIEANAAKCSVGWKSKKSTLGCTEVKSTEQWQLGELDITKITKSFSYIVATGLDPSPLQDVPTNPLAHSLVDAGTRPMLKLA